MVEVETVFSASPFFIQSQLWVYIVSVFTWDLHIIIHTLDLLFKPISLCIILFLECYNHSIFRTRGIA